MSEVKRIKRIVIFSIIALFIVLIITFLAFFRLEKVEVVSGGYYTDTEIKDMVLNKVTDRYTYLFALRSKLLGIDPIPFVEKVDYEIIDKNTIKIFVYERKIAGCVNVMGKYFCFDREGTVTDSVDSKPQDVALVTGIDVGDLVIGQKIDTDFDSFDGLMGLVTLITKNEIKVQEISYDFRGNITLFIDDDEVLIGKKDSYDLEINNLSNIMKTMGEGAFRFDLRYMDSENMSVTAKQIDK
ncbi:MAG: hypothetical protein K6E95_07220 [Lachnospiraceae bacterium]|nr:hypothetical protein [Lachnospiraceae bacterium]